MKLFPSRNIISCTVLFQNISWSSNYICMWTIMFRALEQTVGRHKTNQAAWKKKRNTPTLKHCWKIKHTNPERLSTQKKYILQQNENFRNPRNFRNPCIEPPFFMFSFWTSLFDVQIFNLPFWCSDFEPPFWCSDFKPPFFTFRFWTSLLMFRFWTSLFYVQLLNLPF